MAAPAPALNPQYPSLGSAGYSYFFGLNNGTNGLTGFKNGCKVVNQFVSGCKLWGYPVSEALSNVAEITGKTKGLIAALEVFTKTQWMGHLADYAHGIVKRGGTVKEQCMKMGMGLADWGMAVHDCAMFIHSTQIYAFAKNHLFRGLCFFNFCSVAFSVINLTEVRHTFNYAGANTVQDLEGKDKPALHRYGKVDRPIQDLDYKHMYISIALSVAYLALFFFSVPQLAGLAVYAQYASFLHQAQWVSLAMATGLTITMGIWNELKVKPFDDEYYRFQRQVAAAQT